MVGLSKCCRSAGVDLLLIVALKVHVFIRATQSDSSIHDFQAQGGTWGLDS